MKITKDIREALKKAVIDHGGQSRFAIMVGTTPQNISKYLNGRVTYLRLESWDKLAPHLAPYLYPLAEESALTPKVDVRPDFVRIADALESIARSLE